MSIKRPLTIPSSDDRPRKDSVVTIRVTQEEYKALRAYADLNDTPLSSLIRAAVVDQYNLRVSRA